MRWRVSPETLRLEKIARLNRLSGLNDKEVRLLVEHGSHLTASAGQRLTEEGAEPNGAYLIIDGEVVVQRGGEEVGRLGPGELVGEIALLNWARKQTATVEAASDIEVLRFDNDELEVLYRLLPHLKRAIDDSAFTRLEGDAR